jgi:aldose 1-epimerase
VTTEVAATTDRAVPVSFGWHPNFRLAGVTRREWRVSLPVRRRARLDGLMIPTGADMPVSPFDGTLGSRVFDDLFTELEPDPVFVLEGGGRRTEVAMGDGYPMAQVCAPIERDVVAFEPMTAPGNALVSGDGLRWVAPGERFTAAFAVTLA